MLRRPSPANHRPSRSIYRGTGWWRAASTSQACRPVMIETSCSTERPPNTTPTRSPDLGTAPECIAACGDSGGARRHGLGPEGGVFGVHVRQVVLEQDDIARAGEAPQHGCRLADVAHHRDRLDGEALAAQPAFDRLGPPGPDEDHLV